MMVLDVVVLSASPLYHSLFTSLYLILSYLILGMYTLLGSLHYTVQRAVPPPHVQGTYLRSLTCIISMPPWTSCFIELVHNADDVRDQARLACRGKVPMLHAMRPCAKVVLALLATITSHPWTDIVGDAVHDHRRRERASGSRRNDVGLAPNVKKKSYFVYFLIFISFSLCVLFSLGDLLRDV